MFRLLLIIAAVVYMCRNYDLNNKCDGKDCENCPFPKCEKNNNIY